MPKMYMDDEKPNCMHCVQPTVKCEELYHSYWLLKSDP